MKTVLILTDLSEKAEHATLSSARLIEKLHAGVFLYHTYYDSPLRGAYARGLMVVDKFSLLEKEIVINLNRLAVHLRTQIILSSEQQFNPTIDFQCGEGSFGNNVASILKEKDIELIVMGVSARSTVHNLFFSNDTLSVIENSPRPALIISEKGEMKEIRKVISLRAAMQKPRVLLPVRLTLKVYRSISGDALMQLSDKELGGKVETWNVFTRMFPDAKLRIINALKAKNEIVAMTGDGVNDGPALKAANIGIAIGIKGTEIAKRPASLILLEDELSKMMDAIAMGRRIYTNLRKAVQYIISIHVPIVLTVFIPLALGLLQKLRPFSTTFFNSKELTTSIIQGLVITVGTLATYRYAASKGADEQLTPTIVFTCLIAANILLTPVNLSFYYSLLTAIHYKNNLVLLIIGVTLLIFVARIYIGPLARFFGFKPLSLLELAVSASIGFASVIWFEIFKGRKRLITGKASSL